MDEPGPISAIRSADHKRGPGARSRSDAGEGRRLAREPFRSTEIRDRWRAWADAGHPKSGRRVGPGKQGRKLQGRRIIRSQNEPRSRFLVSPARLEALGTPKRSNSI